MLSFPHFIAFERVRLCVGACFSQLASFFLALKQTHRAHLELAESWSFEKSGIESSTLHGAGGEVEHMTLKDKQNVAQTSMVYGSSNGEGVHVQSDCAKSCADSDVREVNIDNTSLKTDSLRELLQVAQEYESEEAPKKGWENGCDPQMEDSCSPEERVKQSICVEEDVKCASDKNLGTEILHSEGAKLKSSAPEEGVSASSSLSQYKTAPTGDQKSLQKKKVHDLGQARASENRRSSRSSSSSSISVGQSRSHFTIPQPFSLATDKRAAGGGRPRDYEGGQVPQKPLGSNGAEDLHFRTSLVSRKLSAKSPVAKFPRAESIKHLDEPLKRLTIHANPGQQDEDAMSISSVRSCSQAPKAKASRFTSTSGFQFQSDVRAEKRKEYYLKLQERLSAKEEEMKHFQARSMKEKEEEIKLLRKSMTFRASPVPIFYQEGPPPKAELPKVPNTRAKSPNFTRRDSHGSNRLCNALRCEAELRSSLSLQKPGIGNNGEVLKKENQRKTCVGERCLPESLKEQRAEGKTPSCGCANALELLDGEISVTGGDFEDVHVKVRDPLTVSCKLTMSDEEEKDHTAQIAESKIKHVTSNGEEYKVHVSKISPGEEASSVNGFVGRPTDSDEDRS